MTEKTIDECVKAAYAALNEAVAIADKTGHGFSFAPAYGMGGYYTPRPIVLTKAQALEILESGKPLTEEEREKLVRALRSEAGISNPWEESADYGWVSSSQNC